MYAAAESGTEEELAQPQLAQGPRARTSLAKYGKGVLVVALVVALCAGGRAALSRGGGARRNALDSFIETKEEAPYYLGAAGAQCGAKEDVPDASECEGALKSLGKDHTKVAWNDSHRDLPKGCSYEPGRGSDAPHFNTATSGSGNHRYEPVCTKSS